jgi:UDP-N-acetyl-2-amino-2-deoxyglucuronate dehydrogenase
MEKKVKFAIVGCGRIAQRHAEHISKYGELVAVCDIHEPSANSFAEKYFCKEYYNIDDMLTAGLDMDVVAVCSPNGLHADHSIKVVRAGYHSLCEKPMAITTTDCGRMISEAEKANKRIFIIKQNRFNPPIAALKKLVDEGRLGKIYSIQLNCFWNRNEDYYKNSWKGTAKLDGGTLFTQFSHFIDLLYWIIGDVTKVYAITKNYAHKDIIEFEDSGVALLEFDNGAMGTINYNVNSYGKNMEGSLTVFGEKGTVKIGGQYLNELEYQSIDGYEIKDLPEGNKPNNYGTYVGSMSNHDKIYENVIDVLLNGKPIVTNFYEGMKTVEIIEKIYNAAKH